MVFIIHGLRELNEGQAFFSFEYIRSATRWTAYEIFFPERFDKDRDKGQ